MASHWTENTLTGHEALRDLALALPLSFCCSPSTLTIFLRSSAMLSFFPPQALCTWSFSVWDSSSGSHVAAPSLHSTALCGPSLDTIWSSLFSLFSYPFYSSITIWNYSIFSFFKNHLITHIFHVECNFHQARDPVLFTILNIQIVPSVLNQCYLSLPLCHKLIRDKTVFVLLIYIPST